MPALTAAAARAAEIMKPLMDAEDAAVAAVEAELSAATLLLAQCVAELATASEPLIPILQAPQSQTGRRKTTLGTVLPSSLPCAEQGIRPPVTVL